MDKNTYDFCGWATKNDLKCADGRIIRHDAFKECDGITVPLVWNHRHDEIQNVLGHALLENRPNGVFTYCSFNEGETGQYAKMLVKNGDITQLSIYANQLKQNGADVLHGAIREVSLVHAGANPGAFIENVMAHSCSSDEECIIIGEEDGIELYHADSENSDKKDGSDDGEKNDNNETINDVFNTLTEKQKNVVYAMIAIALEEEAAIANKEGVKHSVDNADDAGSLEHSADTETVNDVYESMSDKQKEVVKLMIAMAIEDSKGGESNMKHNVFSQDSDGNVIEHGLTADEMKSIFADAKKSGGRLSDTVLAHGITNIEYLFPEAQANKNTPDWYKREDAWVTKVMNGVHKTPFSRVKSRYADITADEARAKGYIKGNYKSEEVFSILKRETTPQTIYKKQKLDRDDITDITDFDVVNWVKGEMRGMLNEEIARAILIGDGRVSGSDDKISADHIRPIWGDSDVYTINETIEVASDATEDAIAKAIIRRAVKSRKGYKGSGKPVFFTTEDYLTDMLLMEDTTGRVIYETEDKLKTALRVSEIITVPVMENQTRTVNGSTHTLVGIIVNLDDYNVGADKGGAINMFDDFDIDYNAEKYLIETRCSGAMVKPKSAIALELVFQ